MREYYSGQRDIFKTKLDENSPVEFWGMINIVFNNFLTNTEIYPWMPTEISEDKELPF